MGRSKDPILSVRLNGDLNARLTACAAKLDLSKNDIARHAIRAAVESIEATGGKITLPLEMAVKKGPVVSRPFAKLREETERATRRASDTGSTAALRLENDPQTPSLNAPQTTYRAPKKPKSSKS